MGIEGKERKKTVCILGIDGYIGWALANYLKDDYEVFGIDNLFRRKEVKSLAPIADFTERKQLFEIIEDDISENINLEKFYNCDAVIHLAEQPSAPWSMVRDNSFKTQKNNILGTLNLLWTIKESNPNAHLIKLGTMGEYGTPPCDIPEGFIEDGPMKGMMFPRQPGSFYHLSKVFDSMNIDFACRMWGLRSTDIMQGIVFGHEFDTRFDYDEYFGTVINRFCVQAISGIPLTVYGRGGQTRGYLPLKDSIECIRLIIENPPDKGQYRVVNQYAKIRSVNDIAIMVAEEACNLGYHTEIKSIPNPRIEKESHTYVTKNDKLKAMGYDPKWNFRDEIRTLLQKVIQWKDGINKDVIMPKVTWK